jgi:hypothetical protein
MRNIELPFVIPTHRPRDVLDLLPTRHDHDVAVKVPRREGDVAIMVLV